MKKFESLMCETDLEIEWRRCCRCKLEYCRSDLGCSVIGQSAIVEQLMMMVISKMAQAVSFAVNSGKGSDQLALLL